MQLAEGARPDQGEDVLGADVFHRDARLRHELRHGPEASTRKACWTSSSRPTSGRRPPRYVQTLGPEAGLLEQLPAARGLGDPRPGPRGRRAAPTCTARWPAGTAGRSGCGRPASGRRRRPSRTVRRRDTCPARGPARTRRPSRSGSSTATAALSPRDDPARARPTRSRGTAPSARGPGTGRGSAGVWPSWVRADASAPRSRRRVTRARSPRIAARWSGREAGAVGGVHLGPCGEQAVHQVEAGGAGQRRVQRRVVERVPRAGTAGRRRRSSSRATAAVSPKWAAR